MKTPMLILISAFIMAACGQNQGANTSHSDPPYQILSGFLDGDDNTIEVKVTDKKPASRIELVSPTGQLYPAARIDRSRWSADTALGEPEFGVGVGVFGGSNSGVGTAIGIGLPTTIGGEAARRPRTRSTAQLRIPDPAGYRSDWRKWQIRVGFDDPPRQVTVPAPKPPEN